MPVVIGVIDSGIAFAHVRFRNLGGTRISNLWGDRTSWAA